jgi:uncharacterized protein
MIESLRTPLGSAAVVFSLAFLAAIAVLSNTLENIQKNGQNISVTGSAERIVTSDTAKVQLSITQRATVKNYAEVSRNISRSAEAITDKLANAGFTKEGITVNAPRTSDICVQNNNGYQDCSLGVTGHDITIDIMVETDKVTLVQDVTSRISAEAADQNISLRVNTVEYFYNGLKDLRVTLLNEATANAKLRAEEIAKSSGSTLGKLTDASTGVFQVTQKNSVDVSDYGTYDTSTIEKKVTAIVRTSFELK